MEDIRTVFISDVHLGTISCKSEALLKFLKFLEDHQPQEIFLVGDIIDLWKLRRGFSWKSDHNTIIQKILRFSRQAVKVTYITGNHDEYFRTLSGIKFGDISVVDEVDYTSLNGKRIKVIHGDQFDIFLNDNRIICLIGSIAYDLLVWVNSALMKIRSFLGFSHWSLSSYLKTKAKSVTNVITIFKTKMVDVLRKEGYDGVICGHIHNAAIENIDDFLYLNCGDWTESCTALCELVSGKFVIIAVNDQSGVIIQTMPP